MKTNHLVFLLCLSATSVFAAPKGFVCSSDMRAFDGGQSSVTLSESADGTFEMTYDSAAGRGYSARQVSLGAGMECTFSATDPFVAYCSGKNEVIPERHLSNFFQSTKQIVSAVNPWGYDGTTTNYVLTIAAPSVDDQILKSLAPGLPAYNAGNKSLSLSFHGCKLL